MGSCTYFLVHVAPPCGQKIIAEGAGQLSLHVQSSYKTIYIYLIAIDYTI